MVDFLRAHTQHPPLTQLSCCGESEQNQVLGVHIIEDLSWNINIASWGQENLTGSLHPLYNWVAPVPIVCSFYQGRMESILTSCRTVWCGGFTPSCQKTLQHLERTAEKIIGAVLPTHQDIWPTKHFVVPLTPHTPHTSSSASPRLVGE